MRQLKYKRLFSEMKRLRMEEGKSNQDIAHLLGVRPETVSRYLKGLPSARDIQMEKMKMHVPEFFRLKQEGKTNREIAKMFGLTPSTISVYLTQAGFPGRCYRKRKPQKESAAVMLELSRYRVVKVCEGYALIDKLCNAPNWNTRLKAEWIIDQCFEFRDVSALKEKAKELERLWLEENPQSH